MPRVVPSCTVVLQSVEHRLVLSIVHQSMKAAARVARVNRRLVPSSSRLSQALRYLGPPSLSKLSAGALITSTASMVAHSLVGVGVEMGLGLG